jgi:two-component system sensor histidine kinase PilS (NtrC family)
VEKIFEPFYTSSHRGTGLGLYIVNQLCELNGADLQVTRNEFGGSSFILIK